MHKCRVIKKHEVMARLFDDPDEANIERRLAEMRNNANALKMLMEKRPSRRNYILSTLDQFRVELEASATAE